MKIILESIREILSEGRVEDVRKKFPNLDPKIIDFFVENDPSGNNKYLEWMVKAISHQPTTWSIGNILNDHSFEDGYWGNTAAFISGLVNKFHRLLPYMVYTEDGVKQGTTDLYQYKFTDSEMINYLIFDLDWAEQRKEQKIKEKELKKGIDKIYEDKDWLVLRPKTWVSSCHYGAGTKWCTTSRDSDRHFKRETERKLLIYVISKKLDVNNATYKVAWQIPYVKNLSKFLTNISVDLNKVKFWDAEDISMGDRNPVFTIEKYFPSIPQVVKTAIVDYGQKVMDEFYSGIAYHEDPRIRALIEALGIPQESANEIEELQWTNYGMKVYLYEGDGYTVSDENGVNRAKILYSQDFIDMNGVRECIEVMGNNWENYVYITDPHGIANEMADSYISDLSDDEILEEAKRYIKKPFILNGMKELLDDYSISSGVETDLQEEEEELDIKFQNEEITASEYNIELERIRQEGKELTKYLEKKLNQIKDKLRNNYFVDYLGEMESNPIRWLKDFGWWENDKPIEKALKDDIVSIDEDTLLSDFVRYMIDIEYFSSTGNYDTVNMDGERYYIFPTDI